MIKPQAHDTVLANKTNCGRDLTVFRLFSFAYESDQLVSTDRRSEVRAECHEATIRRNWCRFLVLAAFVRVKAAAALRSPAANTNKKPWEPQQKFHWTRLACTYEPLHWIRLWLCWNCPKLNARRLPFSPLGKFLGCPGCGNAPVQWSCPPAHEDLWACVRFALCSTATRKFATLVRAKGACTMCVNSTSLRFLSVWGLRLYVRTVSKIRDLENSTR